MSLLSEIINSYCENHSSQLHSSFINQERNIALHSSDPSLASDFIQGRLLSFISKLKQPNKILEIGTFWGYSTACLAEGLPDHGIIHSIEKNELYKSQINDFLLKSGCINKVKMSFGNALEIMKSIDLSEYDLIFVDAAKNEYKNYYDLIINSGKKGTTVILDNVLWKNTVAKSSLKGIAKNMHILNNKIKNDIRVENFILPLRDGLNIITIL